MVDKGGRLRNITFILLMTKVRPKSRDEGVQQHVVRRSLTIYHAFRPCLCLDLFVGGCRRRWLLKVQLLL